MADFGAVVGAAGLSRSLVDSVGMTHRYAVLIDHAMYHFGDWSKVTGLSVSWQAIDYRVGTPGSESVTLPGAVKYEPITLSRAACLSSRVVQYWLSQTSKDPKPQSGTIQLVDFLGTPLVQWRLTEFFPIAWSIESFDAAGAKPAVETLKLVHSGFLDDQVSMLSPL